MNKIKQSFTQQIRAKFLALVGVLILSISATAQYCTSGAISTDDEDITRVSFGTTLNNTSACASLVGSQGVASGTADLYSDFTSTVPVTQVMTGSSYPIDVQITECGGSSYSHTVRVFIDFNQNGILNDPGEEFNIFPFASANTHTVSFNITIPSGSTVGNTRMRIVCSENDNPGPCTSASWGETEDYLVNIIAGTPASYVSSSVAQVVTGSVSACAINHPIVCIPVVVGPGNPIGITQFVLGPGVTTNMLIDVAKIHIYYTGTTNEFYPGTGNEFVIGGTTPTGAVNVINGSQALVSNATNYFWIAYDINGPIGDLIDGACAQITVGGANYVPTITNPAGNGTLVVCPCVFTLGAPVNICSPSTHTINGPTGFASYRWSPGGQTTQNIIVDTTGTYTCTASINSADLVLNGNFSTGNTGFTSDYNGSPVSGTWGLLSSPSSYAVTTSPNLVHNHFYTFGDHTTGTGKMMVCNGSDIANTIVWEQTIFTTPNTNYNFSAWVASVMDQPIGSEAQLQFSINGSLIGPVHNAPLIGGVWSNFIVDWYSGANTSATITIVNQCLSGASNDFAIDDITYNSFCTESSSVTVTVNPQLTPTFEAVGPYCTGVAIPALPTTSTNGITGTWAPAINNTATTVYTFTPTTGLCATTTTLTITITPDATPTFAAVGSYCSGAVIPALPLTSTNGITGTWIPAINNTATTVYTFTPTAGQCFTNATLTIIIDSNITPTFAQTGPFCFGTTILALPTMSTNGISGTWSPAINNTATTTYTFIPTVGQCATSVTQTVDIINYTIPEIFLNDTTVCNGSIPFTINTSSHGGTWTGFGITNSMNGVFDPSVAGIGSHIVTYQLNTQCGGRDSITVTVEKTPAATIFGDSVRSICEGQSTVLNGQSNVSYLWSTGENTSTITASSGGVYVLSATNFCGLATDTVTVIEYANPVLNIGRDTALCLMSGLIITAPDNYQSYQWSSGENSNVIMVQHQGRFALTVTNEFGCEATDQIFVKDSCDNYFFVPNAFTPDADDLNSEFKPKGINVIDYDMKIFDRWGKMIFQSSDINKGWNGRVYSGYCYPVGLYMCYIEYSVLISADTVIKKTYLEPVSIIR